MVVLEDIIEEYIAKFNEEPQYPRGTEGEAIDLLIEAIEANKPLRFDINYDDPDIFS